MEDVQGWPDTRGLPIERAGVRGIRLPVLVRDRQQGKQQTVASFTLSAGVRHDEKGAHMSRFLEVLEESVGEVGLHTAPGLLEEVRDRLRADTAAIEVRFPYFLVRTAPVSGARGMAPYDCWLVAESGVVGERFALGVRTPVTTLCPCSKTISDYGAHNQRGAVTVEVTVGRDAGGELAEVWVEELIEIAEQAASAPVYPVLKRADERRVTMQAYDNPVFVEDIVRDVAIGLLGDQRCSSFRVRAESCESIHSHDAFAEIDSAVLGRTSV
jgi:GTP cyclohydrolase I